MKKHFLTILIAAAAAALLTGCGTGSKSGTYAEINGVRRMCDDFRNDPDAALDAVLSEQDPEPGEIITLENDRFTITKHLNADDAVIWNGTCTEEQSALKFAYETAQVSGNANPEQFTAKIPELNRTGAYPSDIMPQIYKADIAKFYSRIPVALLRGPETAFIAEQHGDFLCVPLYGLTVDGKYAGGKDFAMDYMPEKTLRDDKYSKAYFNEANQAFDTEVNADSLNVQLMLLSNHYGVENSESMQFHLSFSGGKWEMLCADGKKLTGGAYKESKKHPGFLSVYEEPDDPQAAERLSNLNPLFLYIDSDGKIYYPGFVRKP